MSGAVVGDDLPGHTVIGCNNVIGHHSLVGIKCQDMKYKIRSLRTAYRKIFMSTDANSGGIENRLAEVEKHEELAYVPAVCLMVQSIRDSFSEDRRGICKSRSLSVS
ncbi:hypothetical protein CsSME_00050861 [Camellia sinensis var. sinensis]